jgi:ubiquitin carboxyl-terminal hydrolase 20/33
LDVIHEELKYETTFEELIEESKSLDEKNVYNFLKTLSEKNVKEDSLDHIQKMKKKGYQIKLIKKEEEEELKETVEEDSERILKAIIKQRTPKLFSSPIHSFFSGYLLNEIECLNCKYISQNVDPFLDLSLSIPDSKMIEKIKAYSAKKKGSKDIESMEIEEILVGDNSFSFSNIFKKSWNACLNALNSIVEISTFGMVSFSSRITLTDCLQSYFLPEYLDSNNQYKCSNCKCFQNCVKKFSIIKIPDVLCIQLKRFNHNFLFGSKLSTQVDFSVELDLIDFFKDSSDGFIPKETKYELVSVINHYGSLSGGHYTCYTKHEREWYLCNDSLVTRSTIDEVLSSEAYVLFYEIKNSLK